MFLFVVVIHSESKMLNMLNSEHSVKQPLRRKAERFAGENLLTTSAAFSLLCDEMNVWKGFSLSEPV